MKQSGYSPDAFGLAGLTGAPLGRTNLFHDTGLALGESDVSARFVADELDLNLAAFTAALLIVVIIVVGSAWTGAFDAASLAGDRIAIADRMRIVKLCWGGLVVLICDVGHFGSRYHEMRKGTNWWRCSFERCADGLDLIWRFAERLLFVAEPGWGAALY